ncbi:MAG: hypothetical protein GXO02_05940 [Epsilonproteobacteria bacterium]|nr:hypothetical protein [Campylobacterota bacterium]
MLFGSISYLNLLPFQIFLKQSSLSSQEKAILRYKKDVPAKVNQKFLKRKIDGAFISSIYSFNKKCTNLGIVAKKEIFSVLIIPKDKLILDKESNTSNILAQILQLKGEVVIGDKALKYFLSNNEAIDLAKEWDKKFKLPFVFARLCFNKNRKKFTKIEKNFLKRKIKIPQYILKKEAKKRKISTKELKWYLSHIHYKIGYREKLSLKKFQKLSQRSKLWR